MKKDKKIDVSIILACYNEGPSLSKNLFKLIKILNSTRLRWEIIAIDDVSQDQTFEILKIFSKKYKYIFATKNIKNIGRGGTVTKGMVQAKGKIVGFIDIDLEISHVYIPDFIREVLKGNDIVLASRTYAVQLNINSILRSLASIGYRALVKILLGLNFKDTEAGYKFFNRHSILPVLKKVQDKKWFFDTEIVARGKNQGLKISELHVEFHRRADKKSTVRLFRDTILYFVAIVKFKMNK